MHKTYFRFHVYTCRLSQILSFALTLKSDEAKTLGLPDFPLDNLHAIIKILVRIKIPCSVDLAHRVSGSLMFTFMLCKQ